MGRAPGVSAILSAPCTILPRYGLPMDELSALIQRHATDSTEPAPGVLLTLVQKLTPPSDGMASPSSS